MSLKNIHIGTSGWHYDHWKGPFYPENTRAEDFLEFYTKYFRTAEINNSFYHLPSEKTFVQWRDSVPDDFVFTVKASRYITHMKKLKDPEQPVETFLKRIDILEDRLGPVLFQLPPRWRFNGDRLSRFLDALPDTYRYAFEFRDESWFKKDCYGLLQDANASFCIYDLEGRLSPKEVTADFIYIRLHGPDGAYKGKYDRKALASWAGAISTWSGQGRAVYCYFDNDEEGYAVQNARELSEMIE